MIINPVVYWRFICRYCLRIGVTSSFLAIDPILYAGHQIGKYFQPLLPLLKGARVSSPLIKGGRGGFFPPPIRLIFVSFKNIIYLPYSCRKES